MANEDEELSDLEYARVVKWSNAFAEFKKTVTEDRLRLNAELSHLDPEDLRKVFLRKNGTIRYNYTLPEYYKKLWCSIDLDVMYQQFSEFIENVMETSNRDLFVSDDHLEQPENGSNCRGIDKSQQTGDSFIKDVIISDADETIRNVSEESSSTIPQSRFGIDWSKWFPPLTFHTFLSHYLPISGAVSHTLYTIHLFSPNIISRLFPTGNLAVSNTILFNANVGLGFYVYFRRNLNRVNPWERIEFSVLTSTLFNFISLPAAVFIKSILPAKSQTWLKTLFATSFSVYLLSGAYRYMGLFDSKNSRSFISTEAMYSDTGKFDSLEVSHLQLTDISDQAVC